MSVMKIVAEAGPCNGDVEYAIDAAKMAKAAGAWGFKVQMYHADALTQQWAKRYANLPSAHKTQHGDFSKVIHYDDWVFVKDECDELGIKFFASCFDYDAVDVCEVMGVEYYKIASGEITNTPLIEYVGQTGKHVILSTGASTTEEIQEALKWLDPDNTTILACSLEYPASDGLMDRIRMMKLRFPTYPIGYSDHTMGVESTWVAAAQKAVMLEKHFTIAPGTGGDHDMGVTPIQLQEMVHIAHRADALLWTPNALIQPTVEEQAARRGARRGVYYAKDMEKGDLFGPRSVVFLRPNYAGVTPGDAVKHYGKKMASKRHKDEPFVELDVE